MADFLYKELIGYFCLPENKPLHGLTEGFAGKRSLADNHYHRIGIVGHILQ